MPIERIVTFKNCTNLSLTISKSPCVLYFHRLIYTLRGLLQEPKRGFSHIVIKLFLFSSDVLLLQPETSKTRKYVCEKWAIPQQEININLTLKRPAFAKKDFWVDWIFSRIFERQMLEILNSLSMVQ
jgi:hypothetical protein